MSTPFFDANVLVYAFGQADPRKPVADALMLFGGIISIQVLNEFTSVARKKLRMDWNSVRRSIEQMLICCSDPRPLTLRTHWLAQMICMQHRVEFYDGLILASAHEAGCGTLYTEGMQHGRVIEGVRIVNPFL